MKKTFLITTVWILFTSCATILKRKTYDLDVTTNLSNAKVKVYDKIYSLPNKIEVIRSNKDLKLTLISDTLNLDYKIKTSPNPTFLFLNLIGLPLSPLNYAIDFTNKKRFYYGHSIVHLNSKDTLRVIEPAVRKLWTAYFRKKYPKNKKDINLSFSIPYINGFSFEPNDFGRKTNTGFWGISAGLEYFYKNNKYVSLKFVAAADLFAPFPGAVDYDGATESISTIYVELTDNFKFGRLNLGYGLNYSVNNWRIIDKTNSENEVERKNQSFGITTNTYFQFSKSFFVGAVYRPTFYRISPTTDFKYEHLISLDFAFKIPLRRK